jgi:hypothetical protein
MDAVVRIPERATDPSGFVVKRVSSVDLAELAAHSLQ